MFGEKKIKGTAFVPSGKSDEIKAKTKTEARTLVSLLIRAASRTLVDRGISVRGCEHAPHGQVVAAPAQSGANRAHGYLPGPAGRGSPTTDGQGAFRPSPPSAAAASPPIRLQLDPERNQTARASARAPYWHYPPRSVLRSRGPRPPSRERRSHGRRHPLFLPPATHSPSLLTFFLL